MSQEETYSIHEIRALLLKMEEYNKDCVIDWTNRTIRILSDVIVNEKILLSTGRPAQYKDILFQLG